MVTGDDTAIGKEIAGQLGLGRNILPASELQGDGYNAERVEQADGYARVFPEHKFRIVEKLQQRGHLVGMTGDGVNDAPALKQADVGIAVAGATDAARAAAAIVLTMPGLSVIINAIEEARRIFERMTAYAIYRITETIRIMIFVVLAMLVYQTYPITAIMIILLALLNDLPIMAIAYDNTWLPPTPVRWDMRLVLTLAAALGAIGVVETFALLVIAKNWLGVGGEQLQSLIFLKLVVAGHMTLLVARSRQAFYAPPYPRKVLLLAITGTQILAALIVGLGWFVAPIAWSYVLLVWLYCLVWLFIEDSAKRMILSHMEGSCARHRRFLDLAGSNLSEHHHR
jgi:H+-transporting ATPase